MIDFGKYDQKVTFRSFGGQSDGYAGNIPVSTDVRTCFAKVIQMKGSSSLEQAQLGLPRTYKVHVLVQSGFTPSTAMVLVYRGEQYKIIGVEKVQERLNWEWVIMASGNGS